MRRLTLTATVAVLLAAGPALAGQEGETRLYGPSGEYQGRATPDAANPRQKSLYGPHGEYRGRAMVDDQGNARVYDQHGKYIGRTTGGRMTDPKK
ncbi:MAG: hypothetical protein AAGU21_02305 [Solidesulfovibrio sp.]|uniref:hypothetical protein n=1 Tax=Solidesulfovibrio sp. TaxID=2910990 RepID=UPI00315873CA